MIWMANPATATIAFRSSSGAADQLLPMEDNIRFDKSFDLAPGKVEEVAPEVRRLLADNPGPFTFKGTVSYIIGRGNIAILDPGPEDQAHIDALLNAVRGETVTHIFVTHTHRDHSPAAAAIKQATGAKTYAEGPHRRACLGWLRRGYTTAAKRYDFC